MRRLKSCSMEITQQVRDYTKKLGMDEDTAQEAGTKEMAEKFRDSGAEVYQEG